MRLSEFFAPEAVARDGEFATTLHPKARQSGALCYALSEAVLRLANRNPGVTAVLTTAALAAGAAPEKGVAVLEDPARAYFDLHNRLAREDRHPLHAEHRIDSAAEVSPSAVLGRRIVIGPGVRIGHGAVLHDYTVIEEGTTVAEYAVIGARGMQNLRVGGSFYPVAWCGGVRIGRGCEILTGAVIQRPYHCEYTEIGEEARISVRANIGHGCRIGARTMAGGSVQIGGNVEIGEDAWIGQGAVLCDGLRIGARADIKMGSVVVRNVADGEAVSGNFAVLHETQVKEHARLRHG